MSEAPALPPFDAHALMARLRKDDVEAVARAYRYVFGTEMGRLVLAKILSDAGVGNVFGPGLTGDQRAYAQGAHDAALGIMNRAGFDQASAVAMTLNDQLEGRDDERSADPNGYDDRHVDHDPDLTD